MLMTGRAGRWWRRGASGWIAAVGLSVWLAACTPAAPAPPTAAPKPTTAAVAAPGAPSKPEGASAAAKPEVSPAAAAKPTAVPVKPAASPQPAAAQAKPSGGETVLHVGLGSASASNAGVYLADGLGFFAEQGLKVDYTDFGSASEVIPALSRGDLDIGDVGINPAFFNALARQVTIKLVADKGSMPPGFGFTSLVVPTALADQIKGPADLKGRKLAMTPPGLGTANGFVLVRWLATVNLKPDDVNIVPIAFPEQVAALANRSVDAAIMGEPFAAQAVLQGIGKRVITLDKVDPYQQVAGIVFSDRFITEHRDVGERWMIAYVKAIRAYNAAFSAGTDKDKIVNILTQTTSVKDPKLWSAMVPAGLNPDGKVNVQSIADARTFFTQLGLVQNAPPVEAFLDMSFADAAVKALGPGPTPVPPVGQ